MLIVTSYYNPSRYKNRIENYQKFKEELGHPLLTIENAFGNEEFTLKDSVKVRSRHPIWSKERIYRIAEKLLPKEQEYLIFCDADILFSNKQWLQETIKKLKEFKVVQPFSYINRRFKDWTIEDSYNSYAYQYSKGIKSEDFKEEGHPGFSFACRRDSFSLYDKGIAGTGDSLYFKAVTGQYLTQRITNSLSGIRLEHYLEWAKNYHKKIQGSLSYIDGEIDHLYHGSIKHRNYYQRMLDLEKLNYNPYQDLYTNRDGLLETNRKDLEAWLKSYFYARKEDE